PTPRFPPDVALILSPRSAMPGMSATLVRSWARIALLSIACVVPAQRSDAQPPLAAHRSPVLRQIDLPHGYYYREMYVPQVTSGPSAVTWSPDASEIIYAMQGSLWRQRVRGDGVRATATSLASTAVQLTSEPCYDYQPDWSPKGRWVVFTAYCNDALELRMLDLESGAITKLTSGGAVNLDARWSPDGSRIAYVSTSYNKRWHIFVAGVRNGAIVSSTRLTDDHDSSALHRYYYSNWDHYLSPTWSPDGREIVLVSNRGRVHGTGGFWRMA